MKLILPMVLVVSALAFQKAPVTVTPEDAPLPAKADSRRPASSELEGAGGAEDGVMSLAKYEGGSASLKLNKIIAYVNEKEIVLVQSKQRFAIPVKAVTEISYGSTVHSRVGMATGTTIASTVTKGQSPAKLTIAGIIWTVDKKKGGVVLRIDKGDFSGFMGALQTVTGLRALNTDVKNP